MDADKHRFKKIHIFVHLRSSAAQLSFSAALLDHGILTMRKHDRFFLSLLFTVFFVLGGYAVLQAQQKTASTAGAKRWSDAATWPDKKVPAKDDVVTIDKDMDVVLDVSPPPLHGLTINGKLSFADNKDLELTTEWILLHGALRLAVKPGPTSAMRPSP